MKILVVSQYYCPDITAAAFRITETVDLLRASGHEVRVITALPHKSDAQVDADDDRRDGVHRVPVLPIGEGGVRNYISHYMSFVLRSTLVGVRQRFGTWRPDVVWTSSPPLFVGLTGKALAFLFQCPLVLDIRDIWPESAVSAGQISESGLAFRLGRQLESKMYRAADQITCVSKSMAQHIASRTKTPTTVVYNGVLAGYLAAPPHPCDRQRILYAGNLGRVQGLDVAIRAFARFAADERCNNWTLEFIGAGALQSELKRLAHSLGMKNRVEFHAPVSKSIVIRELGRSAILLIQLRPDAVFDLTIPSKVFDYMTVGRPILYGIAGEGRDILSSTGGNLPFVSGSEDSLLEALRYASRKLPELERCARRNPEMITDTYSREASARTLIGVFEQAIGR